MSHARGWLPGLKVRARREVARYLRNLRRFAEIAVGFSPTVRRALRGRRLRFAPSVTPWRLSSGFYDHRQSTIEIAAGYDVPDACATILHELAHVCALGAGHGRVWRRTYARIAGEVLRRPVRVSGRRRRDPTNAVRREIVRGLSDR